MDGYLSQEDIARRLKIPGSLLAYYQRDGRLPLPTHRVGKRLYFLPTEWDGIKGQYETKKRKTYEKRK